MRHAFLGAGVALFGALCPRPALAFDYLEHSYFADRACREAQARLAPLLPSAGPEVVARYLALSLTCPERWEKPYCAGGYKQAEANLNRLTEPVDEGGDHPVTLGDFTALADHLSAYGVAHGHPLAARPGLADRAWEWLASDGDAGGVVSDVAEDACETGDLVSWPALEADLREGLAWLDAAGRLPTLPRRWYSPAARGDVPRGPHDPAGAYSFDNPHYLDLVRRNHHHFGVDAYTTWLGYQSAASSMGSSRCAEVVGLDSDGFEDLAEGLPEFEAVDWDGLEGPALREAGCRLLSERIRQRLLDWARRAEPALVAPVQPALELLAGPDDPRRAALLDRVAASLEGSVFVGGGLHYLQDSLAGGHLRGSKAGLGLEDRRWDHDVDGRAGVIADWATRGGQGSLVAFGDSYVIGPQVGPPASCAPDADADWPTVTACLVREQRALLLAASTAALLDYVLGGLLYEAQSMPASGCPEGDSPERWICRWLPTRAPLAAGLPGGPAPATLSQGTLPVPPPPWSYQSLLASTSLDGAGEGLQLGVRAELLSQLGARANWMTSYQLGLLTSTGTGRGPNLVGEFAYVFHWRWAARFLVNAGPFVFGGLRGFGDEVHSFAGLGPGAGLSFLPEGWTKMPLEVTLGYRLPITLVDSEWGFSSTSIRIEAHWIEVAVGLAFM